LVANAVLDEIEKHKLMENSRVMGKFLKEELLKLD
jgi:4-aminobutyrate aminotransferase-like enzyme